MNTKETWLDNIEPVEEDFDTDIDFKDVFGHTITYKKQHLLLAEEQDLP